MLRARDAASSSSRRSSASNGAMPVEHASPPALDDLRAVSGDRFSAAKLPRQVVAVGIIRRTPNGKPARQLLRSS